jgi:hypothetical protein
MKPTVRGEGRTIVFQCSSSVWNLDTIGSCAWSSAPDGQLIDGLLSYVVCLVVFSEVVVSGPSLRYYP